MQILRETVLETEEPKKVDGIDLITKGCFVKTTNKGKAFPEWFLDKTLILGYDDKLSMGEGTAEWEFQIPKTISKSVFRADLIIQTFRYQAGLHSLKRHAEACVYINDKKIQLYMDAGMPYGLDYGFDRIVSFRVEPFIKDKTSLKVKLVVQAGVWWDIDEMRLEIVTRKSKVRGWVFFLIGVLASPIADHVFNLLYQWLLPFV